MNCPNCGMSMSDVTESWHTFAQAQGAEYLASYVIIWHCTHCRTLLGTQDGSIEWVLQPEEALELD